MKESSKDLLDAADFPMLLLADAGLRILVIVLPLFILWIRRSSQSGVTGQFIFHAFPDILIALIASISANWIVFFLPSYLIKKHLLHQRRSWFWVVFILFALLLFYFLVMGFILATGIRVKPTAFSLIPMYAATKIIRFNPASKFNSVNWLRSL